MRDYDIESDLKQEKFQSLKLVQGDRGNKKGGLGEGIPRKKCK